jgi:hypothetical protein
LLSFSRDGLPTMPKKITLSGVKTVVMLPINIYEIKFVIIGSVIERNKSAVF